MHDEPPRWLVVFVVVINYILFAAIGWVTMHFIIKYW